MISASQYGFISGTVTILKLGARGGCRTDLEMRNPTTQCSKPSRSPDSLARFVQPRMNTKSSHPRGDARHLCVGDKQGHPDQ